MLADMIECAGWANVAANRIGMKCNDYDVPKASGNDCEFDDR